MEEYGYDIEYVKGKENEVADSLFRLFPITSDTLKQATWEAGISEEEKMNLTPRRMRDPLKEKENESTEKMKPEKPDMHTEFISLRLQPTFGKAKTKPNAIGKLWKEIC